MARNLEDERMMIIKNQSETKMENTGAPITYAALLECFERELEITDDMVQQACAKMDAAQVYPFAREVTGGA
jgi:hypothetical protein